MTDFAQEESNMFVNWIENNGFEVIVFDMDRTMSAAHCGSGLRKEDINEFISQASEDFLQVIRSLIPLSMVYYIDCVVIISQ